MFAMYQNYPLAHTVYCFGSLKNGFWSSPERDVNTAAEKQLLSDAIKHRISIVWMDFEGFSA